MRRLEIVAQPQLGKTSDILKREETKGLANESEQGRNESLR
jgi:hypothetical protein